MEEEKRRHSETQKSMRKKETRLRELMLQTEDDHKTISMLNDAVEKLTEKVKVYKRQLSEQVSFRLFRGSEHKKLIRTLPISIADTYLYWLCMQELPFSIFRVSDIYFYNFI